jgi:hypothetical protein
MFRFDRLIRVSMTVREVKADYPQTIPVFEELGFRDTCDDCALEVVARRQGLSALDVVEALNRAMFSSENRSIGSEY